MRNVRRNANDKSLEKTNENFLRILLDSGASKSIIHSSYLRKGEFRKNDVAHEWSTMAGTFKTTRRTEVKLKLPELSDTAEMSVCCHVSKQQKINYDLILGREILRELGINLDFSNNTTNWKDSSTKPSGYK